MEFEIQVVVWDRHKYVAGFNQLHVFFFLYCIVQYQIRTEWSNEKRTNNDLQNITQKNKKMSNTNPTKNRGELRKGDHSCSTSGTLIKGCFFHTKTYVPHVLNFRSITNDH
jgi:hypothetical protein